jgi:hypothetical protein
MKGMTGHEAHEGVASPAGVGARGRCAPQRMNVALETLATFI